MKKIIHLNKKTCIFLYWAAIILLAFLLNWQHPINADEGINLDGGWRIIQGQIPYIDYFDFKTPGASYLLALIFKIFGPSYMAAKIFSIILLVVSSIGVFYISRLILKEKIYIYLSPVLWIIYSAFYPIINLNPYSSFSLIWAFYLFLCANKNNKKSLYFLSGILSGLTFWFLQTKGVVIIFTVCFLTLIYNFKNLKKLVHFFAGLILSLLPFFYWPISTLYYNFIEFPINYYLPINQRSYSFYFYILIIYLILFFALKIYKKQTILFLWWLGILLLLSTFYRNDSSHIIIGAWPLIIIAFHSLECDHLKRLKSWVIFGLCVHISLKVIMVVFTASILDYGYSKDLKEWLFLKNYDLDEIVNYIKINSSSEDYIYSGPFMANFYFESERKNPTKFQNMISSHYPPHLMEEAVAELKKNPPKIILLNYKMVKKFGHDKNNRVDNFIWENYELDLVLHGIQILKIKENNI